MNQNPRVLLLIPHLGGGGAERVIAELATWLDRSRFDVHVCIATTQGQFSETLPSGVEVHALGASRVRHAALPLLRLIRRLQPDLLLPGMAHLNFLVLLLRPFLPRRTRIVVRQNGPVPSQPSRRITDLCMRLLYPQADAIICQTATMADDVASYTGARHNLRVLLNPVNVDEIRNSVLGAHSHWTGPGPHLLAVGRLSHEKGFDLLLHALSSLRSRYSGIDLTILGDGRDKCGLVRRAATLGLKDAVRFAGHVPNPAEWFSGATLFVAPSRWEGLPNAMLEAACAGLPIVATPARGGMAGVFAGRPGIWLAGEVSICALEQALQTALDGLEPGQRFAHAWIDDFRSPVAVRAYEDLIAEIVAAVP
ncbi:MAG TPA: glycosyltransferase [Terracidiphilus sp.]|nr:glycosyltransferase [Terracidiphilus sp.]